MIDKFVENSWKWLETPYLHSFFKGFHADMATLSHNEYLIYLICLQIIFFENYSKVDYVKIRLKDDLLFEAAQGIHFFKLYFEFDRKKLCADILEYAREYREKVEFWMLSQLIHENHPTTDDSAFINVFFLSKEKN